MSATTRCATAFVRRNLRPTPDASSSRSQDRAEPGRRALLARRFDAHARAPFPGAKENPFGRAQIAVPLDDRPHARDEFGVFENRERHLRRALRVDGAESARYVAIARGA